ncbi:MAG: hypothetical protein AABZ53_14365 [Planctomycetota bacterium]
MTAILLLPLAAPWAGAASVGVLAGAGLGVLVLGATTCRWMIKGERGWARLAGLVPLLFTLLCGVLTVAILFAIATIVRGRA